MVKVRDQWVSSLEMTWGTTNDTLTVSVHETANTNKGADAQAHANLQSNGNVRQASWNAQCDDKEVIRSFRDNVSCWHAGSSAGAKDSYSLELCVNSDGNFKKTVDNGAQYVAMLLKKKGITADRVEDVVTHRYWTGKDCPNYLLDGSKGITWNDFIKLVKKYLGDPTPREPDEQKNVTVDGKIGSNSIYWTQKRLKEIGKYDGLLDGKIDNQNPYWKDDNTGFTTGWDWDPNYKGKGGSKTIHALWAVITAKGIDCGPDDGLVGPQFNSGWQTYLRDYGKYDEKIDGEFWYKGTAAKSHQKVLNSDKGFKR